MINKKNQKLNFAEVKTTFAKVHSPQQSTHPFIHHSIFLTKEIYVKPN
ncbi:MAG: hypothetical protein HN927_00835 [Candidatus Marinimicrobia bacterium]|nr:hypothetical protein [Candidatus Neomarinimicrobiota bacterium]MBT7082775.1 hypothetical protein [Candidatus Neomarinimicrobiota bacterium]